MTAASKQAPGPTAGQIKRLHWGAGLLRLDRISYEALLEGVSGRPSSKQLTQAQARAALERMEDRMRAVGITPPWRVEYPEELKALGERRGMASQKQLRYLWSLWRKYRNQPGRRAREPRDLQALGGFLRARFDVSRVAWLDGQTAARVIEALKGMVSR